jgi:hypothetical protein
LVAPEFLRVENTKKSELVMAAVKNCNRLKQDISCNQVRMNDDNRSKSDSMNFYVTNNQPSDTAN